MAKWQYYLANSKDLSNIAELTQARGRTLSLVLNQAGTASFNYPITDQFAGQINPITSAIKAYRNGTLVWSGYVSTIDEDISGNRMTVNSTGWLSRLDKRIYRTASNVPDVTYTSQDDADIIYDILSRCNGIATGEHTAGVTTITSVDGSTVFRWPSGSSPNTPSWIKKGNKLPNEGAGGATAYAAATRTMKIDRFSSALAEIQKLTQIENGCDIEIDPATRELNIFRKKQRIMNGTANPGVNFGYRWGPNNIQACGRQIDGQTVVNYELALGPTSLTPQFYQDTASQDAYGPLDEVTTLSDVRSTNILLAYATVEVLVRKDPRIIYSMTPYPYTAKSSVPQPFVDYRLGDQVYFSARQGTRVSIDKQPVRVFGMSLNIDEEGNERMDSLQLTP